MCLSSASSTASDNCRRGERFRISDADLLPREERARLLSMPPAENGRLKTAARVRRYAEHYRSAKPRQEICAPIKWICFLANFVVFLLGVTALALGVYLWTKDPRSITEWADVLLNPSVVLTFFGLSTCAISLCGLFGALRDNVFLLKTYALLVFISYVVLVIFTFILFMLFYSDTADGVSAHSVLLYTIRRYHTNRNIAEFMDYLQEQLECCGASSMSQGYRDWQLSDQFRCNSSNPYPERCGVPFSCCRRSVVSEAAGSSNPLLPAMRSFQCWQNAQTKRVQDLENDIHVRGCLGPLRNLFENHAVHFGACVAVIILPVCLGVCLSHLLARQIDYQRYLLDKEQRRLERRLRRERREGQSKSVSPRKASIDERTLEQGGQAEATRSATKKLPSFPPPPVPTETEQRSADDATERERKRRRERRRAMSNSPLRGDPSKETVSSNPNGAPSKSAKSHSVKPGVSSARRRSSDENLSSPPPTVPSSRNGTKHWLLKQSDLLKPPSTAPKK